MRWSISFFVGICVVFGSPLGTWIPLMAVWGESPCEPWVVYVATNGADTSDGSTRTAPVATFERAQELVRNRLAAISAGTVPQTPIEVRLAAGEYGVRRPFAFTSLDGGLSEATRVTWTGPELREELHSEPDSELDSERDSERELDSGSAAILTGGIWVRNFRPAADAVTDPATRARLSQSAIDKIFVADLHSEPIDLGEIDGSNRLAVYTPDGTPLTLARYPDTGFTEITGLVGGNPVDIRGTKGDANGNFYCEKLESERLAQWQREPDAWLHGYWFWDWSDQRQRVASIDPSTHELRLVPPNHSYGYRIGQWFYGLNLLCELDSPGEWYLDRDTKQLFLIPPAEMATPEVLLAVTPTLLTITDASFLTIRNVTFTASREKAVVVRTKPEQTGITFDGCTFRATGDYAISISGGTHHTVRHCVLSHLGAGGIDIGGGDRATLTRCDHIVDHCHIHHYGEWRRMYTPAVGISGVGITVSHGSFHDSPHCAILFNGNDHTIEYNEIYRVIQESQDAGAVYTGRDWTARGTVIRYNYLHDFEGYRGTWGMGIYLDDLQSGTTIQGNVFRNVHWAAFIGGGRDNLVSGNLFIECPGALQIDNRGMGWAADSVGGVMTERLNAVPYRDEPWRSRWPQLLTLLQDAPAAPKGNIVERNVFLGQDWDHIQDGARPYVTLRENWIVENPDDAATLGKLGFANPEQNDWTLRPDSVIFTKIPGFEPIPFGEIGYRAKTR